MGGRAVGLVSTLLITRFITPKDYGSVNVTFSLTHSADYFSRLGLFHYVVTNPKADRSTVFHASAMNLVMALVTFADTVCAKVKIPPGPAAWKISKLDSFFELSVQNKLTEVLLFAEPLRLLGAAGGVGGAASVVALATLE